ncbi:MAG: hypothetical protein ACOYI5_09115, partial [Christensenellales bacterium]
MRIRKMLVLLAALSILAIGAQATCYEKWVELQVPSGYRGVDCTYTVTVNGNELCSGSTRGASTIRVPDVGGDCTYKIVYSDVTDDCADEAVEAKEAVEKTDRSEKKNRKT